MDPFRQANRANWDDRVDLHWGPDAYDAPGFAADASRITDTVRLDREALGDVSGRRLVHLQCHFGMDTLSWARLGADATGVDFSEQAIAAARRLSAESGAPARFLVGEVTDAPEVLGGETFDIVYTGVGALCWLPEVAAWAEAVEAILAPGGTFLIREGHPVLWSLAWPEDEPLRLEIGYPYFESTEPMAFDDATSYVGSGTVSSTRTYEWNHGLAEVMGALAERGLRIDLFEEHRYLQWKGHPSMELGEDGLWRLPEGLRDRLPLMYTLRARKAG